MPNPMDLLKLLKDKGPPEPSRDAKRRARAMVNSPTGEKDLDDEDARQAEEDRPEKPAPTAGGS
jgi:hypothetical protein